MSVKNASVPVACRLIYVYETKDKPFFHFITYLFLAVVGCGPIFASSCRLNGMSGRLTDDDHVRKTVSVIRLPDGDVSVTFMVGTEYVWRREQENIIV